eukprot:scaffold680625_cov47-Prasinocladus_malaysianus.AAC.1
MSDASYHWIIASNNSSIWLLSWELMPSCCLSKLASARSAAATTTTSANNHDMFCSTTTVQGCPQQRSGRPGRTS